MRAPHSVASLLLILALTAGCNASSEDDAPDTAPTSSTSSTGTQSLEGTWGTPGREDGKLGYTFEPGGTYTGWDGCNSSSGTWTEDQGRVTLTVKVTTARGCPALATPETFKLVDDTLVVTAKDAAEGWKLTRTGG